MVVAPLSLTYRMLLRIWLRCSSSSKIKITTIKKCVWLYKKHGLTRCTFNFIKHRQRSMSKLSTWIGFRMNCSYLQKLLSHVISCKITWSFRQNKQILVWFQKLTDLCIFLIQNLIIKQVLKPLRKSHYLLNKQLPPLFYFFVQVGILVPTKPESD